MSILASFGIAEKVLIAFIILVLLKMFFDVSHFMKKRREHLKLKENEKMMQNSNDERNRH